jgi:protein TonB
MFQQTFVSESKSVKTTYTLFLSFALQSIGIACLALLPLIYTQVLPSSRLRQDLTAPPRAPIAKIDSTQKRVIQVSHRRFNARLLYAPPIIPNEVNALSDALPPPALGSGMIDTDAGSAPGVDPGGLLAASGTSAPPFAAEVKSEKAKGPVRVGSIHESNLIRKVVPAYPAAAKAARVQGAVEFTAIISKQGTIENLRLVRGNPLLVNAARDAVLQWRYRPTLLNGEPVEVITDIVVNFTLSQ